MNLTGQDVCLYFVCVCVYVCVCVCMYLVLAYKVLSPFTQAYFPFRGAFHSPEGRDSHVKQSAPLSVMDLYLEHLK